MKGLMLLIATGVAILVISGSVLPAVTNAYVADTQARAIQYTAEAQAQKDLAEAAVKRAEALLIQQEAAIIAQQNKDRLEEKNGYGVNMNARIALGTPETPYEQQQINENILKQLATYGGILLISIIVLRTKSKK